MAKQLDIQIAVEQYLLDCVNSDPWNLELTTVDDKKLFIVSVFKSEKLRDGGTVLKNAADWLQGLPSVMNHEYGNLEIQRLMYQWGACKVNPDLDSHTAGQENALIAALDNYWNRMAHVIAKWHDVLEKKSITVKLIDESCTLKPFADFSDEEKEKIRLEFLPDDHDDSYFDDVGDRFFTARDMFFRIDDFYFVHGLPLGFTGQYVTGAFHSFLAKQNDDDSICLAEIRSEG